MMVRIVFAAIGFLAGVLALLYLALKSTKPQLPYLPPKDDQVGELDSARVRKVLGFTPEKEKDKCN